MPEGTTPVHVKCLRHAAEADEFSIWGGLDHDERRALPGLAHPPQAPRE
jgi:hypothetical protein